MSLSKNTEKYKKWRTSMVENLSKDAKQYFTNQKRFSRANLFSMRKWHEFYTQHSTHTTKVQQLVKQTLWKHNLLIIKKSNSTKEALFYVNKTLPKHK